MIVNALRENVQSQCSDCGGFVLTNEAIECSAEDSNIVKFRAKLFSAKDNTGLILNTIETWIQHTSFIVVEGLRLYFETNCPITIESFASTLLNCSRQSSQNNAVTVTLAVIVAIICAILLTVIAYLVYKHLKKQYYKTRLR